MESVFQEMEFTNWRRRGSLIFPIKEEYISFITTDVINALMTSVMTMTRTIFAMITARF